MTQSRVPPARSTAAAALGLAGWLALCFAVAAIGARASINAGSFYATLVRPSWAPPASLFGPTWTLLYTLMAIAAWLVWRRAGFGAGRLALNLFVLQLIANAAWSWLFFSLHSGLWSLLDISLLWLLIVATIVQFRRLEPPAALLLVPYVSWVSFALALNFAVWRLNPGLL